jgi:hypothetical protein
VAADGVLRLIDIRSSRNESDPRVSTWNRQRHQGHWSCESLFPGCPNCREDSCFVSDNVDPDGQLTGLCTELHTSIDQLLRLLYTTPRSLLTIQEEAWSEFDSV